MRKKSVVLLLSFLSALGFALGATACSIPGLGGLTSSEQPAEVTISGFDVKESIQANVGSVIEIEQPIVMDSTGVLLDCWTYVQDANGNYVASTSGSFTVENVGEYTITYVVRDSANNTYEKKTKITVVGEVGSKEITLTVDFEQFVVVGEEVSIDAVCSDENATLSYKVTDYSSNEAVEAADGKFTPQEAGIYEVLVSANDGAATYKYNVFAELPMGKGEVESFSGAWEEKESFVGGKRQDWDIVSYEESGLLDPYGREVALAKYTTQRQFIPLYINIRENVEYYEQLAQEGYSYVSMWIYMESEKPHTTISDRDPNGGFYRRSGPDLYPGEWIEFRLDLVTGKNTWFRSFVQCYDFYAEQSHFYLQVDNSNEWNISSKKEFWGNEAEITFYFTDIYAVKKVDIAVEEGVETEKAVKDTVNFDEMFSADFAMNYRVSCRGESVLLTGNEYTCTANGEYTVEAIPADFNLRGSKTLSFTVTDEHVITAQPVMKERVGESVSVSIHDLNAAFEEINGVTPTVDGYQVFYGGKEIALENEAFTASKDGAYTVRVKGVYTEDGVEYATYHDVPVDVWSAATKYQVIDTTAMRNIRAWDWDNAQTTAEYGDYTVGEATGDFVKLTAKGQSLTFYAKPMFSKAYYEALLAENANTMVRMDVYFTPAAEEKTTNVKSVFTSTTNKTTWGADYENTWITFEMPIADFIAQYDDINNAYARLANASFGDDTNGGVGSFIHMLGTHMNRTVYLDLSAAVLAENASVALKDGVDFTLKQSNSLADVLDVTVDGVEGAIKEAEVFFNGEWITLNDLAFTPVWANEYAFRFYVESVDGIRYQTLEVSFQIGGESFKATEDTTMHALQASEQLPLSFLSDEYEYEIEAYDVTRGAMELAATQTETTIDGADFEEGVYLIKVYAIDGESVFGKMLYHTLTVNMLGEYGAMGVILETPTEENYKNLFKSYQYASNQHLTCTSITTEAPEGKSGSFLKYEGKDDNRKEAMSFALKPLYTEEFYRSLYQNGRTYSVQFDVWMENVYEDCTRTNAYCYSWKTKADGDSFTTHGLSLALKQWHTVEISLDMLLNNLVGGEVKFFGVYIPYGGFKTADLMRMYIGNIRIVMNEIEAENAEITVQDGAEFSLNEHNALADIFNATIDGAAARISDAEVFFNDAWVALSDLTFKPVWAGEYLFRITAKDDAARTYKTAEITVQIGDEAFEATVDNDLHKVESGNVFSAADMLDGEYEFSMKLLQGGNVVATIEDGTDIETDGLAVGSYTVNVYANSGDSEFGEILYYVFTLDVWSEATKYAAFDSNSIRAIRAWDWDSQQTTAEYGEYTVGETTSNLVKMTSMGQSLVFYAKPMYSKAYYAALAQENAEYIVSISIYYTVATTGKDTNFRSFYNPNKLEWKDKYNDSWQTYELRLAQFVTLYDEVYGKYEEYKDASYGAGTEGYQGSWMQLIGSHIGRTVYFDAAVCVKEKPMQWSTPELTMDMLSTYQYSSNQNCVYTSITEEIPEGGVAGKYIKWAQGSENKEDIQVAVAPSYDKAYYEALLASGKNYKITYDVYLTINGDYTGSTLATKLWTVKSDGSHTFATHGKIGFNAWYTVEIDLNYLVANWGNYRLLGISFTNGQYNRSTNRATFWMGNIQLVEGVASGVATLKA